MKLKPNDRRRRDRAKPPSTGAGWRQHAECAFRRAVIRDVSDSGIGLDVAVEDPPAIGDKVRILLRSPAAPRSATVVRTVQHRAAGTRLGCRWIDFKEPIPRKDDRAEAR